ncbi:unnamed protein product [Clavelina lepadiformis]|uniref:Uncharacterized protein n=1 Tax=Clavelina lepadiformis TaxID=159417 RepID=A0ABP0F2U7_CLALP
MRLERLIESRTKASLEPHAALRAAVGNPCSRVSKGDFFERTENEFCVTEKVPYSFSPDHNPFYDSRKFNRWC